MEHIWRLAEINRGKHRSEETKQKLRDIFKGKPLTEETKQKMSKALKGRKLKADHAEKSKIQILKVGIKTRFKSKPVYQLDLNNNIIKEWAGAKEASKNLNINESGICHCCNGIRNRKVCGGFKWKFVNDSDNYKNKMTEETKNKISSSKNSKENKSNKCILQFNLNDIFIKEWVSISEAEKFYKVKSIGIVCRGKGKTAVGFKWKFKEIDINNENI